jgi:hypothetical protein
MGLIFSPFCRKAGADKETSIHLLCECDVLLSLRHVNLGSFFLDPGDVRTLSLGAIWNFSKNRAPLTDYGTQRACLNAWLHRDSRDSNPVITGTQNHSIEPICKAKGSSADIKSLRILWSRKVCYRLHKNPKLNSKYRERNTLHVF